MMIFNILKWIFYFLVSFLLLSLVKDLRCYLYWRKHYKHQGIPFNYIPIVGMMYNFIVGLHP